MGFVHAVWNWLLSTWIRIGTALFPRTIHPEIVHFPIALLYLALFIQVIGYVTRSLRQPIIQRSGFWVLTMSLLALVATAAAGILSEQYVRWTPQTTPLLSAHQRDAVITGLFALSSWLVRIFTRRSKGTNDGSLLSRLGRGQTTILSDILLLGAVIMVTVTGSLGGTMVYHYGAGTPSTVVSPSNNTSMSGGSAAPATTGVTGATVVDKWLSYTPQNKTVYLMLHAGLQDGYNFNGYQNGAMTVTVPVNWSVHVSFFNASSYLNHSAMIVPYTQVASQSTFTPAFSGASVPNPVQGISPGASSHFLFKASQSGQFAIVCDIPGHASLGMWAHLDVSSAVSVPSIVL